MASDFGSQIDELLAKVGSGDLAATVVVNQVYARWQHDGLDLKHPRGGQALYLQQPLMDNHSRYLADYASQVLEDGGKNTFISAAEDLAGDGGVASHAPVEFGDLRASGHPTVTDGEEVIYDRPPLAGRLSAEDLKAKDKARDALNDHGHYEKWHGEITGSGVNAIHHHGR